MSILKLEEETIIKTAYDFPMIDIYDLANLKIPEAKEIVRPFIVEGSSMEIFGQSGKGKTWFTLELCLSIATGQKFMKTFGVINPRPVWYIDGEMKIDNLRNRVDSIMRRYPIPTTIPQGYLNITNPYIAKDKMLNKINDKRTQQGIREKIKEISDKTGQSVFIVFDNLSCLTNSKENDADDWVPMLDFYTQLKSENHSILHIHHSGKSGQSSRGTSRRHDALDTIIQLQTPSDYVQSDGAYYNIEFNKTRNFAGQYAEPFGVKIKFTGEKPNQTVDWDIIGFEDRKTKEVLEEYCSTYPQATVKSTSIATGIPTSTVQRVIRNSKESGQYEKIMREKHGAQWEKLKQTK